MAKAKKQMNADELTALIVKGIQEKKGENIVQLDLRGLDGAVTDFYIVCEATSTTQVGAIADSIEKEVRETIGEKPWHVEGTDNLEWVLLDYVNVVAHVFQPDKREFFNIEELWADAKIKEIRAEY
ncbi:MAG: ribosome silencing factor [Flavobacteriales bacterium]|nr:ribosome silencing factor [Flavobacteriales bacterium]